MKYRKSFYEHGCTTEIADHIINYGLWYQIHDSPRDNEQVMYVGWDKYGDKLWEIGIELYPLGKMIGLSMDNQRRLILNDR